MVSHDIFDGNIQEEDEHLDDNAIINQNKELFNDRQLIKETSVIEYLKPDDKIVGVRIGTNWQDVPVHLQFIIAADKSI